MANYGNKFGGSQGRNYALVDASTSQTPDMFTVVAYVGLHQDYGRDNYTYYGYLEGSQITSWSRPSKGDHWSGATTFSYRKYHNSQSGKIEGKVTTQGGTSIANYWFNVPAKDSYTYYFTINKGQSYNGTVADKDNYTVASLTKWYNESLTVPPTKPLRTGYTFTGWGTDNVQSDATLTYNGNLTMQAQWRANKYKINFNLNQGTWSHADYIEKTYDSDIQLPSEIPTRQYYKFLGWTSVANSNSPQYVAGALFAENVAEDTTLYACWELRSVDVYLYKPELVTYDNDTKKSTYVYSEPTIVQGVINTNFTLTDLSINVQGYEATGRLLTKPQEHYIYFGEYGIGKSKVLIDQITQPYHLYVEVRDSLQSSLELIETKFDWVVSDYTQDEYAEYINTGDASKLRKTNKTTTGVIAYIFRCTRPNEIGVSVNTDETYLYFKNKKSNNLVVDYEFKQYLNNERIIVIAKVNHVNISSEKSYTVVLTGMYAFDTAYVLPYIVDSYKRPITESYSFDIVSESIIFDVASNKTVIAFGDEANNNKSNLVQSYWDLELIKGSFSAYMGVLNSEDAYQLSELQQGLYFTANREISINEGTSLHTKVEKESLIFVTSYIGSNSTEAKSIYSIPLSEKDSNKLLKRQLLLDTVYPVGSVYMNVTDTKPEALGMEWTQITGRVLVGSGLAGTYWKKIADEISDTIFTITEASVIRCGIGNNWEKKRLERGIYRITQIFPNPDPAIKRALYKEVPLELKAGAVGGNLEHSHKYGVEYGEYYGNATLFGRNAGVLNNGVNSARKSDQINYPAQISDMNSGANSAYNPTNVAHYRNVADTSAELSYPPYKVVNMWVRTN